MYLCVCSVHVCLDVCTCVWGYMCVHVEDRHWCWCLPFAFVVNLCIWVFFLLCICTNCVSGAFRGQKRASNHPELELLVISNHNIDAGNWTQFPWKSRPCSQCWAMSPAPASVSPPYFLKQGFHWILSARFSLILLDWLAQWTTCIYAVPSKSGVTRPHHHTQMFTWVLGVWTQVFPRGHFTDWAICQVAVRLKVVHP